MIIRHTSNTPGYFTCFIDQKSNYQPQHRWKKIIEENVNHKLWVSFKYTSYSLSPPNKIEENLIKLVHNLETIIHSCDIGLHKV